MRPRTLVIAVMRALLEMKVGPSVRHMNALFNARNGWCLTWRGVR